MPRFKDEQPPAGVPLLVRWDGWALAPAYRVGDNKLAWQDEDEVKEFVAEPDAEWFAIEEG